MDRDPILVDLDKAIELLSSAKHRLKSHDEPCYGLEGDLYSDGKEEAELIKKIDEFLNAR